VGADGGKPGVATDATVAVLFRLGQDEASAKHNGRFYVPGLAESDTTTNYHTDVGGITNMHLWGEAIRQIEFGAGLYVYKLVIKGTQGANEPNPGERTWHEVLSVEPKLILHGIRRRKSRIKGAVEIVPDPESSAHKHVRKLAARKVPC
jgi:hypothetical protein